MYGDASTINDSETDLIKKDSRLNFPINLDVNAKITVSP